MKKKDSSWDDDLLPVTDVKESATSGIAVEGIPDIHRCNPSPDRKRRASSQEKGEERSPSPSFQSSRYRGRSQMEEG